MRGLLHRVPLRVKLVAATVALVAAALLGTGIVSAVALRSYLIDRVDGQLRETAQQVDLRVLVVALNAERRVDLPSDYAFGLADDYGNGGYINDPSLTVADLPPLPQNLDEVRARAGQPYTTPSVNGSLRWRMLVVPLATGQNLVVAQNLADVESAVERLVIVEGLVGVAVLVLLAAVGFTLVRTSLGPLRSIEATAAAIAQGDLTRRVPEADPRTEVGSLARSLNSMLAQIEGAFRARAESEARALRSEERMRQFVADASHELRTPLTTIRGFAELYRQGAAQGPNEVAALMRRVEDEASRMGLLVEDLLLLARLDQERPLVLAPVELRVLASDAVAAARAVAPDREISLDVPPARAVLVLGDESRLRQVIGNLVTNALTHTPAGTPVTIRLAVPGREAVLEIADRGPGLTAEQAERVFERFYRVDKARARQAATGGLAGSRHSGAGLGLAIVAGLVAAHDGRVEVDSAPGGGARFRVLLPLLTGVEGGPPATPRTVPAVPDAPAASTEPGGSLPVSSQPRSSSVQARAGTVES